MDILITLTLVVLATSIIVFFSQEFTQVFKKIFAIPGAKLFIPIVFASWLVFQYKYWIVWGLKYYRDVLREVLITLSQALSLNEILTKVLVIILLTCVSIIPVVVLEFYLHRKTYKSYPYPYLTSTVLWLVSAIPLLFT
jgi:hypothetical protein